MSIRAELERRLQGLPLLTRQLSRFGDSYSYFLADREIAHFHGDQRMDVRLTKERIRELKTEGALDPRVRIGGPSANWVTVRITEHSDLAFASQLVEEAIRANSWNTGRLKTAGGVGRGTEPEAIALNLANETYLIRVRTKSLTELYFKDEAGWCKISSRGRRFRATPEQVLNHLLPALAGLAPTLSVEVEHYKEPRLRPLPAD